MKIEQLLTEPIISKGFWESWEFFVMQIPLELGLGIWLLSGLFRKAAWLVAVLAFGLFMIVTLQKGLSGADSCGCFGKVHVNPWVTFTAIDVSLFLGLLFFRPRGNKFFPPPWPSAKHFFGVAAPTISLLVVIVVVLIFNKPPDVTSRYEVVRPERWTAGKTRPVVHPPNPPVGGPNTVRTVIDGNSAAGSAAEMWPLLKYIDIAESLRKGLVVVLMYHYDCPDCRDAISRYDRACREMVGNDDAVTIAFIGVPPYGPAQEDPFQPTVPV